MPSEVRIARDESDLRRAWEMLARSFGWEVSDFERFASGTPLDRVLVALEGDEVVACSRIREFGQFFGGRRVPLGGFSPVGVAPEARGRGLGSLITAAQFPLLRERGEVLAGLYPATNALYRRVGFELAGAWGMHRIDTRELQRVPFGQGTSTRRASDDDRAAIEACYRRIAPHIAGFLDRSPTWWDRIFTTEHQQIYVVDGADGEVDGYVRYRLRWPENSHGALLDVSELMADAPDTVHALWRLVGSSSSIAPKCNVVGPPEDPLLLSLPEQDLTHHDAWRWMARIIDAPGAIAARGYAPGSKLAVSVRLTDPQCEWNNGRWRLVVEDGEAVLEKGGESDIELGVGAFSALFTGYANPRQLATTGMLRGGDERSLSELAAAFAGPMPWTPDFY